MTQAEINAIRHDLTQQLHWLQHGLVMLPAAAQAEVAAHEVMMILQQALDVVSGEVLPHETH